MRASALATIALGLLAVATPASAKCRLQVKLASGSTLTRSAKCVDGDASCDDDGKPEGTCDIRASLCFSSNNAACDATDLSPITIASAPGLGPIIGALQTLKSTPGTICTEPATVTVVLGAKKKAQLPLKVLGAHGSQRFAFICQKPKGAKGGPPPATFDKDIQKKIFTPTCATEFCHGATAASAGLDLSEGAAIANLVNVPAAAEGAKAAHLLRVAPGDPDDSFLVLKIENHLGPNEGVPMPLVGGPLPQPDIDTIRRWIQAGAPDTAPF